MGIGLGCKSLRFLGKVTIFCGGIIMPGDWKLDSNMKTGKIRYVR